MLFKSTLLPRNRLILSSHEAILTCSSNLVFLQYNFITLFYYFKSKCQTFLCLFCCTLYKKLSPNKIHSSVLYCEAQQCQKSEFQSYWIAARLLPKLFASKRNEVANKVYLFYIEFCLRAKLRLSILSR